MARQYLEVGEIIPPGAWFINPSGHHLRSRKIGTEVSKLQADGYYVEVDTLPPEVIALMTEIRGHITSVQQLMQTLETRLNTLDTVP